MLGFRTTAEPEVLRRGPQPYAATLSVICEAFTCTPDVAARQDWATVAAVLEYRAAVLARDAMNDTKRGMETFKRSPELYELLAAMHRAQRGESVEGPGLRAEGARYVATQPRAAEDDG